MAYEQKPGSTSSIALGGQYDDPLTTNNFVYDKISAEAAANAALSAQTAATSAAAALVSENNADTSEANALTSANAAAISESNADTSEANALTSANNAAASATTATTQAGIATTKAGEASTSATNAANSETSASNSAIAASTSESNAAISAANAASSSNSAQSFATSASNNATAAAASAAEAATILTSKLDKNSNLSDLTNVSTARTNLGLGSAATLNAGSALGVATLDAGGTVPLSQIPTSIQGGVSYQGTWDASTNTPTLTSSVGSKGNYYVVSVAGSTTLNGVSEWKINDWAIFNGLAWEKIDNTDLVTSVNGYTGTVVLTYTDVGGASAAQGALADTAVQPEDISTMAYQSSSSVNITGGTLSGVTLDDVNAIVGADHLHFKVKATENISKGDPVRFVGFNSGEGAIEVAKISSSAHVAIGVAHDTLTNGSFGAIVNTGVLRNINTSTYTEGTILYPAVGGGLTPVKPTSGYYQAIAFVLRSNTNNGTLLIEASEPQLVLGTAATTDSSAYATAAQGAKADTSVQQTSAVGSADIPTGTTAERDGSPQTGYFRFNTSLGKFEGYSGTTWGSVGGGATGGGADAVFIENDQTVTANYTIPTTKNAMSTGPVAINSGVTITVSSGARWVVI